MNEKYVKMMMKLDDQIKKEEYQIYEILKELFEIEKMIKQKQMEKVELKENIEREWLTRYEKMKKSKGITKSFALSKAKEEYQKKAEELERELLSLSEEKHNKELEIRLHRIERESLKRNFDLLLKFGGERDE